MVERTIPVAAEAEDAAVGSVLIRPGCLVELDDLPIDAFHAPGIRRAIAAARAMAAEGRPIDPVSLASVMGDVGDLDLLLDCALRAPTAENIAEYARLIRRAYQQRQVMALALEAADRASTGDPDEAAAWMRERLGGLGRGDDSSESTAASAAASVLAEIEARVMNGAENHVPTGLRAYDGLIGPLAPPRLYVVAARPGIGKTALAVGWAHAAAKRGVPALVFSLEMSRQEVFERLLSADTMVAADRIARGTVGVDDFRAMHGAAARWSDRLTVTDRVVTIDQLCARARAWRNANRGPRGLIVIDYLGLLRSNGTAENRNLEVGAQARACKVLAKDLATPVILVAQLNRASEREDREPRLSDLRDSGEIEAHADAVIFPHRSSPHDRSGPAALLVRKNRGGRTGSVPCYWHAETMRFLDVEDEPQDGA